MARRRQTGIAMAKRRQTGITMAKRRRTGISRGAGSSVMEKIELERSGIKSGGLSSGISERHITHGSSIATGHLSGVLHSLLLLAFCRLLLMAIWTVGMSS
jgi:hypothetical protein